MSNKGSEGGCQESCTAIGLVAVTATLETTEAPSALSVATMISELLEESNAEVDRFETPLCVVTTKV